MQHHCGVKTIRVTRPLVQPRAGTDLGATTPTQRGARPYSRGSQRRAATCFFKRA